MTAFPTPLHLLDCWINDLHADRADGTIKRYQGATLRFLSWYQQQEQQTLVLADLTPITLVSYRTDLQRAYAPSTVNTHVSALRAWCAWLTEHGYLTENPARRFKLVGRTDPLAHTPFPPNRRMRSCVRQQKLVIRCVIWLWCSSCSKPACALVNVPRSPGGISVLEKSMGRCSSAVARATKRVPCP